MEIIYHRINTVQELSQIPFYSGVEIDVRDYCNELILQHDPFLDGEKLEDFLKIFGVRKGTLILNIKSERIEFRVKQLLDKYYITNYFFLDCSFPMIINLIHNNEHKIALRYSEFEKEDTIFSLKGKVDWIWIDCFTKVPGNKEIYNKFKAFGFKLCFVSPELQGKIDKTKEYKDFFYNLNIELDAVCCKKMNSLIWH